MAVHARLKNEFMEDEKSHNLMTWLNYSFLTGVFNDVIFGSFQETQ